MSTEQAALEIARLLQIPSLVLQCREGWGAQVEGHREMISEALQACLLSNPEPGDSSISHAEGLGGFALLPFAFPDYGLGFDIELTARIRPEVARRICRTQEEFAAAPSLASLWCAKEAAYKAMKGPWQPTTVMGVRIFDWQKTGASESFHFHAPENPAIPAGKGLSFHDEVYGLAIALLPRENA